MGSPKREMDESLVNYAEKLAEDYTQVSDLKERKLKGQFLTPKQVSSFMADLFDIDKQRINLLDPGAGIGILSAAFCNCILNFNKKVSLSIDAYENDPNLLPFLKKVLKKCKSELEKKGHEVKYKVFEQDFILHNSKYLKEKISTEAKKELTFYDYIISNPPYYKLNKNSPQSTVMADFVSGQPNIYIFFMALSLNMLKPTGEMVFITPRSFCSGLYYKRFREWLLNYHEIRNIHIFESRSDIFDKDEVLQENIIIKTKPKGRTQGHKHVVITTSKNKLFENFKKMKIEYQDIIHYRNGNVFIKIPLSRIDIKIQRIIGSWRHTLRNLGLDVSTGPVVPFRTKDYLSPEFKNKRTTAPLLWMHNIKGIEVLWPLQKNKKEVSIYIHDKTKPLLLPTKNYVLVKRFSSKEQKRRLYAGVLLESKFSFKKIGIENHINYIYKCNDVMPIDEAYGIAAILNTSIIDNFFRSINGNTQVNALDIRNLPLPSLTAIKKIGNLVKENKPSIGWELDRLVVDVLGIDIDKEIIETLNGGYRKNG